MLMLVPGSRLNQGKLRTAIGFFRKTGTFFRRNVHAASTLSSSWP